MYEADWNYLKKSEAIYNRESHKKKSYTLYYQTKKEYQEDRYNNNIDFSNFSNVIEKAKDLALKKNYHILVIDNEGEGIFSMSPKNPKPNIYPEERVRKPTYYFRDK